MGGVSLADVRFVNVLTCRGTDAPHVGNGTGTVQLNGRIFRSEAHPPLEVASGNGFWTLERRLQAIDPMALSDAADIIGEARREFAAPADSVGQTTLFLARADRKSHESIARRILE